MGNQMKNQVFEAEAGRLKYEKGGSSIRVSEPSFLRLPGGIPRRQRSNKRVRVSQNKEMSLDTTGSSEVEIVQKHPGQVLYTACTGPRTRRKRKGQKLSDDFGGPRGQTRRIAKINKTRQQGKLDDNIFNKYLGNLWRSFPSENKDSFTYLDCLWFTMYGEESKRVKVLDWIKKKQIFSKNYVFLPVCKWGHWSLLIFCHLGEDLLSKTKTPCMLVLDSMQTAEQYKQLEPEIRKFLLDIFNAEDRKETKELINKIPFLVPKVPQQRDNKECGNYVLYYLTLFLMNAPETINTSAGYPYFMKEDWFTAEGLESFCRTLDSSDEF